MKFDHVKKISATVRSVHDLQKMRIMQEFTQLPIIYVFPQVLLLKDKKFMENWCKNVRYVWSLSFPHVIETSIDDVELTVFHKETGDLICRYKDGNVLFR